MLQKQILHSYQQRLNPHLFRIVISHVPAESLTPLAPILKPPLHRAMQNTPALDSR